MSTQEILSRDEWTKAVKRRLGVCKFEILKCDVRMLGDACGFLGEHRLVDITVRCEGDNELPRVLHFFYKTEPHAMPEQKDIISQTGCFEKEVDAFNNLFVQLRSALEDSGEGMEWACKCFYSRSDIVVLDNLVVRGYRIINCRDSIGFQHCAAALKALANLHSASLIFEETRTTQPYRLDTEFGDVLAEGFFKHAPNHPGSSWLMAGVKGAMTLVEQIYGQEFLRRTKTKLEKSIKLFYDLSKPSKRFRNVVNHGDLWRNNVFFRSEGEEPVEARLVDYQLVRYAPPANDISCFLYLSTDRALRDQYGPQLLALYYDHLSDNLKRHGLEAERILPWEELKASCNYYKMLGVVATSCYASIILLPEELMKPVFASSKEFQRFLLNDRSPEIIHAFKTDSFYRERATEIIEELIEECVDKEFDLM